MRLFSFFRKRKLRPVENKYVFDKAKYHDDTIEKLGLEDEQSFVHTGLFFAWLVDNNLMSEFFIGEHQGEIEALKKRRTSPSAIYMDWDGTLIGEMLNEEGFSFSMDYFDFTKGRYLKDYKFVFELTEEIFFEVEDTWENYNKLKPVLDSAYAKWKK